MGFLSSNNGELREPLVWPQGCSVSIRVGRGSTALLPSHGRVIRPQDALKGEYRVLSVVAAGNSGFPRHVTVTSGSFSGCLWEVRNIVELKGPLGTPMESVQRKRASSRVEAGKTGLFFNVAGNSAFLLSWHGDVLKLLEFHKACRGPFRVPSKRCLSLETLQRKRASSSMQGRIS